MLGGGSGNAGVRRLNVSGEKCARLLAFLKLFSLMAHVSKLPTIEGLRLAQEEAYKRKASSVRQKRSQHFYDRQGYYKLLGLQGKEHVATQEQIKDAFRRQILLWHPDKCDIDTMVF